MWRLSMKNPLGSSSQAACPSRGFSAWSGGWVYGHRVPVGCGFSSGLRCSPPRCPCSSPRHVFAWGANYLASMVSLFFLDSEWPRDMASTVTIGNMACEACRNIKIKQEYKAGKSGKWSERVGLDWKVVVGIELSLTSLLKHFGYLHWRYPMLERYKWVLTFEQRRNDIPLEPTIYQYAPFV